MLQFTLSVAWGLKMASSLSAKLGGLFPSSASAGMAEHLNSMPVVVAVVVCGGRS